MASSQQPRGIALERVYVKDLSFESPKSPDVFTTDIASEVQIDVQARSRGIDEETVEVTLRLTVKSVEGEDTIFLIEMSQAGIFTIRGYTPDERFALLATECPLILHGYARAVVADLAIKGGFPELLLQPVDFHSLFEQNQQAGAGPPG